MQLPYDYVRLLLVELHLQDLHAEAARARLSRHVPDTGFFAHCGAMLISVVRTAAQGGRSGDHTRRIWRMTWLTLS